MKITVEELMAGKIDPKEISFKDISDFCIDQNIEIAPTRSRVDALNGICEALSQPGDTEPLSGDDQPDECPTEPQPDTEPEDEPPTIPEDGPTGFLARRQKQIKAAQAKTIAGGSSVVPQQYAGEEVPDFLKRRFPKDASKTKGGE